MRKCIIYMLPFLFIVLSGCKVGSSTVAKAKSGTINKQAPVQATLDRYIPAPKDVVWKVLTDVENWPDLTEHISRASLEGPLEEGSTIRWKANGSTITSEIVKVDPETSLFWVGSVFGNVAIHLWELEDDDGNTSTPTTKVTVSESISGPLIRVFYSSKKLEAFLQSWLDGIHEAAIKRSQPSK